MKGSRSERPFETKIISLAAFLWYRGYEIASMSWDKGMCTWSFRRSRELLADVSYFEAGTATVNPKTYYAKVTEFKRMIYTDPVQA